MIVLSNSTQQTVAVGESIIFDVTVLRSHKCAECHRVNTGSIKMLKHGDYIASFSGNVGGPATTPVQLTMELGGDRLRETTMISVSATAGDLNNVSTTTGVRNCCLDYSRLSVVNTGTVPIIVGANSCFMVDCCGC